MSQTQEQIAFVAQTLLTASSDRTRSLQGTIVDGLIRGTVAFVDDKSGLYKYEPADTNAAVTDKVVKAAGPGNWTIVEGVDPIEVRCLADLPAPVATVITLLGNQAYRFVGTVDIGVNRIVAQAGTTIEGGGHASITGNNNTTSLITGPTGASWTLAGIGIVNAGGSALRWIAGDNDETLWLHDCWFAGVGDAVTLFGDGTADTPRINIYDCKFYGTAQDLQIDRKWGAVSIVGCQFLGTGNGLQIISGVAADIATMLINGCEFSCEGGGGDYGVLQVTADAVAIGRLVGCNFHGTNVANAKSAFVATTEWQARGNVNVADF